MSLLRAQRVVAASSAPVSRVAVCAVPKRMHSGDMFVAGISRTVNFGFFSGAFTTLSLSAANKKDYPAWYQGLMDMIKGTSLDRKYTAAQNYRRYGLRFEDLLVETPDVAEAIKRLPKDVLAARDDRIKRAFVLNTGGDELPRAQWTSEAVDLPYLAPYLGLVVQERRDREAFRPK